MNNVLVFSIALNGYQYYYKDNINSHREYSERYGYDYQCVSKPIVSATGIECAWLKIPLILAAFRRGYKWVMFIDADARINESCPSISEFEDFTESIFMARGYSERFNSGVIITRNQKESSDFFNKIITERNKSLPEEDNVGWGENGHVIHFSRNNPNVRKIDKVWNNNHTIELDDYIRHFSAGPMRSLFSPKPIDKLKFVTLKTLTRIYVKLLVIMRVDFSDILISLTQNTRSNYDHFS